MTIITGNKGFIGTNLTNLTGWDGFDREKDIRDYGLMSEVLEPYDTVIHLAALAGVGKSLENESEYVDVNINGTYNIARICYEQGKRLIFAGSSSVYEAKSPYARTKQGCEDIINAFVRHGLNACILRFFTVFGEHNRKDMAVYKFTQAIRRGETIPVFGNCQRDFTYVQDLCKAIREITGMDITGTHDLGFGKPMSVIQLIQYLERDIGKEALFQSCEQRDYDAVMTCADNKLMKWLGVQQTPFNIAIRNTLRTI